MRIQHNIPAMNAYRNYTNNTRALQKNLEKLSSGYRINKAGDDAAGLAISEKMRAQITGLEVAQKNAKDGISLVQTAEGALTEVHDMLNRMYELAEQSANGTYADEVDREQLQKEVESLSEEINRIADSTNFNGIKLLDGSLSGGAVGSSTATSMIGKNVSTFTPATLKDVTTGDGSSVEAQKEYFSIDGQTLELDTSKGVGSEIKALLAKDNSGLDADETKALAENLTEKFNQAIQEAGLSGEVKISSSAANTLTLESLNKGADSEFSFLGVSNTDGDMEKSAGNVLFTGALTQKTGTINKATQQYDGEKLPSDSKFQMNINGQKVLVSTTKDIDNKVSGNKNVATDMATAAANLQKDIQTAVANYNTELGLKAGEKNKLSGLVGLKATDFTVEADKSGGFKISYNGTEDVSFSFDDIGDSTIASSLGLTSGSSKKGGAGGLTLQIGDTAESFNKMTVSVADMHAQAMGIANIDIGHQDSASDAMDKIKSAINYVSDTRGGLGALQNRLDHVINNLSVQRENIQDAEATIRDVDVAEEMMSYTKNNILVQSAQAMLAQANQLPQGVLQLLG